MARCELCKSEDEVMKETEVSLDKLAVSVAAEAPTELSS